MSKNLSSHILPTSGGMLGVCMTVISIIKLIPNNHGLAQWADEILAGDAFLFLISAIFSYLSIRSNSKRYKFEEIADKFFIGALVVMSFAVLILTFELT